KSLSFLDLQLPQLKETMEKSEGEYNQFRINNGTIDLPEEERLSLALSSVEKTKLLELEQKREELLISYTKNHPAVIGINKQIDSMKGEINTISAHMKHLPTLEEDLLRLNREVKINTELYTGLLNTAQQLRLVKAGKVSNVRLIDAPMIPDKPIKPERAKIISMSMLLGLFVGGVTVFLKNALRGGLIDAKKIDQIFGPRMICASIPHSDVQKEMQARIGNRAKRLPLLASLCPDDIAIESLRAFRATFQQSLINLKNNIIVITSPTPGNGKSFVSANFSTIMASSGKRVLLIDADFRNGYLHKYFDVERNNGLSECIKGSIHLNSAINRSVQPNLDFLSTGNLPPFPSEFLLDQRFGEILDRLSAEYDLVIIDQPPILAVSDTLVIGIKVGALFMLTRSGVTTDYDVNESLRRLKQAGIELTGILINDFKVRARQYNAYYYGKEKISFSNNS
ncbi:MAG TPA: polysaccharide biosynthesis tyrosine autokinase, partial [Nitrosopumilaceae archaeon]|nr:polysaccharide biosynthesis tyrosine autokinase [Nitrosopumilaceae archaeon]